MSKRKPIGRVNENLLLPQPKEVYSPICAIRRWDRNSIRDIWLKNDMSWGNFWEAIFFPDYSYACDFIQSSLGSYTVVGSELECLDSLIHIHQRQSTGSWHTLISLANEITIERYYKTLQNWSII